MAQARRALAVRLSRAGDRLDLEYHLPDQGRIATAFRSWREVGAIWRCGSGDGPEGLSALLDGGADGDLLAHCTGEGLTAVGHMLFDLLFGEPAQWESVLRRAFGV